MLKALLFAAALLAASPALAQTAADTDKKIDDVLGGPHAIYATAIQTIETAVGDLDELTAKFDTLFTPKVISAVTSQKYENLMVSADGIMFGDGELWISGVCDDDACQNPFINIIAINTK